MPVDLTLSVMSRRPETASLLRPLLDQYASQARVRVHLEMMTWESGHADLNRAATSGTGPDVSEVGSTWVSDLVAMKSLRPYSSADIARMGGAEAFLPAAWMTSPQTGEQVWSAPWTTEVFLIHYRKDLLARTGLSADEAFASPAAMLETARLLGGLGLDVPIALPLNHDRNGTLHCLAPFLWRSGARFLDEQGGGFLFAQPEARRAVREYYQLLTTYTRRGLDRLHEVGAWKLFRDGEAAVAFGSQGLTLSREHLAPEIVDQVGVAGFRPHSFVGGTSLVMWNHARHPSAAADLVRFLVGARTQVDLVPALNALPAVVDALDDPAFVQGRLHRDFSLAVQNGRGYGQAPLWGVVEDRLTAVLASLWDDFHADPTLDLDAAIEQALSPLARRLALTFSQYRK